MPGGRKIAELFYDLRVRGESIPQDLKKAEAELGRFTAFLEGSPVAAGVTLGAAIGAALVAVGVKASAMAAQVEQAMGQVDRALDATAAQSEALREEAAALSVEFGRSQADIAALMKTVADNGPGGAEGLRAMTRAALELAALTGDDPHGIARGLDNLLDAFGRAAEEAPQVSATLYAVTRGRVPLGDLLETLGKVAASARAAGVDMDTLIAAVGTMLDAGLPAKQVKAQLEGLAEAGRLGAARLKELAGGARDARADLAAYDKALLEAGERSDRLAATTRQELDAAMIAFGKVTLPAVNAGLRILSDQLDATAGRARALKSNLQQVQDARIVDVAGPDRRVDYNEERTRKLRDALIRSANDFQRDGAASFQGIDGATLAQMRNNVEHFLRLDRPDDHGGLTDLGARQQVIAYAEALRTAAAAAHDVATATRGAATTADSPVADRLRAIKEATKDLGTVSKAQVRGFIAELDRLGKTPGVGITLGNDLVTTSAALTRDLDKAGKTLGTAAYTLTEKQTAARAAFASATAGLTPGGGDNVEAQVAALVKAATEAKLGTDEIAFMAGEFRRAAAAKVQEQSDAFNGRALAQLAAVAGATVTAAQQALAAFDAEAKGARAAGLAIDELAVARTRAALAAQATQVNALEAEAAALDGYLEELREQTELSGNLIAAAGTVQVLLDDVVRRLDAARQRAQQARTRAEEATSPEDLTAANLDEAAANREVRVLVAERAKLLARIAELQGKVTGATQAEAAAVAKVQTHAERIAGGLKAALNVAAGLAVAFGGANSELARMLTSTASVAGGVEDLLGAAKKAGGIGKLFSSASGLAAAAGPIGAIVAGGAGLLSALNAGAAQIKAAQAESAKAMGTLTEAIAKLRDAYLQSVSSTDARGDLAFAQRAAGVAAPKQNPQIGEFGYLYLPDGTRVLHDGEGRGPGRRQNLEEIARAFGLATTAQSADEQRAALRRKLEDLDTRYGTNLVSFFDREAPEGLLKALKQLPAGIKDAIGDLGRFGDDAAGVIARVAYEFGVLGRSDPAAQFTATVEALRGAGKSLGEFEAALRQLEDPTLTATQREALVQGIVTRLRGTGLDFGDLTPDQLRALLQQGAQLGAAADGSTADTSTSAAQAASAAAQLTEATGLNLVDYSRSQLTVQRQSLDEQRATRSLLERWFGGGALAAPPVLPAVALPPLPAPPVLPSADAGPAPAPSITYTISVSVSLGGVVVRDARSAEEIGRSIGTGIGASILDQLDQVDRGLAARAQHQARAAGATPRLLPSRLVGG